MKRDVILEGDFAECMEELQKATDSVNDVKMLISSASQI